MVTGLDKILASNAFFAENSLSQNGDSVVLAKNQSESWPKPYDPWSANEFRYPARTQNSQLSALQEQFVERSSHYIGYPNSRILNFDNLSGFLKFNLNNIGDPYHPNAGLNTCHYEQEVIAFCADLFHLDQNRAWGYITNGSTESIMFGVAQGRDTFPDSILIFSEQSHYCLPKIAHLLRMPYRVVPSHANGDLDLDAFTSTISSLEGRPCVINLTVGTTFHGAIEAPEPILDILESRGCMEFHLHIDAALYGPMLPFIDGAPCFDFSLPINSLSFSGHKFMGAPIPCGVVLCDKERVHPFGGNSEYVGSVDTTLSGSRDGFSALLMWTLITRLQRQGLAELALESVEMAERAVSALNKIGISSLRNPYGNVIVFAKPSSTLASKWQLATSGDLAHIITLPGVTTEMLNNFIGALKSDVA